MKRARMVVTLALTLALLPLAALACDYKYMSAGDLEQKLRAQEPVKILDIQVEPEYQRHHIKGAVPTYSYPVKTPDEKARLDEAIPGLNASASPIVIVCPKGGGGAERTYNHLKEKGLAEDRLFILEKGQAGWTSPDFTETGK